MQHLHNRIRWDFSFNPAKQSRDSSRDVPTDAEPTWVWKGVLGTPGSLPFNRGTCWAPPNATCLLEILRVVLGGHKDDCLVLGLHHAPEQVEQHGRFVVPTGVEESQLQREGRAQPLCIPTPDTLTPPVPSSRAWSRHRVACRGWGAQSPSRAPPGPSHLELLAELGLHVQTDQHRLGETCGMQ